MYVSGNPCNTDVVSLGNVYFFISMYLTIFFFYIHFPAIGELDVCEHDLSI